MLPSEDCLQPVKSLPPNDAHLSRDGSAAPCQSDASVPSTQATFTDSHHVGVPPLDADDLSQAAAQLYYEDLVLIESEMSCKAVP